MGIGNDLLGDLETLLTTRALRRKALFRMSGPDSQCWRAEMDLQQMYPGTGCLLLPSATVGLTLLLETLEIPPGREVLIAPFGWLSNWSCIERAGLVPRFLPLDESLQLRAEQVAERINDRTGAVIVTHLMGRGQQAVPEIARICDERGVPMLEDVAQSFGVSIGGRRAGTFGSGAWCSLNHHKLLSTGDGGFVLVREGEKFAKVSGLHDQGCVVRDGARHRSNILEPGLSLRSNELVAAVLRAQLARFHFVRARILALHGALGRACEESLGLQLIPPHHGDLPFTVLFKVNGQINYPPLKHSGWHVAPNVPWLERTFADGLEDDPDLGATLRHLATTAAVGAGFVDPYYAIHIGLAITDPLAKVPEIVRALEEQL